MAQRTVIDDIKDFFRGGSMLKKLLLINLFVFLGLRVIGLVFSLSGAFANPMEQYSYWYVDGWPTYLMATSNLKIVLFKFWSIITYNFVHVDLGHIFFNLLIFYFTGRIFQQFIGDKKILSTYILGGVAGWFLYALFYNIFPVFASANAAGAPILGASASVMAVMIAAATMAPNIEVRLFMIFPIKFKWIAIFMLIADLINIESSNPGGHIAHLGGAAFGFISVWQYQKGRDILAWFDRFTDSIAAIFTRQQRQPRMRVERGGTRTSSSSRPSGRTRPTTRAQRSSDEAYKGNQQEMQRRVDEILDKISQSGYESLSKAEKEFLFKYSNRNN